MLTFGADRSRTSGEKVILLSAISKGWVARRAKTSTHAEHPGTAVMWEEQCFEVIEASPVASGGVRYVLAPWRDEHTIRTLEQYDAQSETARLQDFEKARRQRRASAASRWSGLLLGHLPEPVQRHLQNELGIVPSRITLASCVPPLVLTGVCVYVAADAMIRQVKSPLPLWIWPVIGLLMFDTLVRFVVVMSQARGVGSFIGTSLYVAYWLVAPHRERLVSPFGGRGDSTTFTLPPPEGVELRDELELKAPLLTLLSPAEQRELEERHGFDYKRHAYGTAWTILVFSAIGAATSFAKLSHAPTFSALASLLAAAALSVEQIVRLLSLKRGPAGSVLAFAVRPFVRALLA